MLGAHLLEEAALAMARLRGAVERDVGSRVLSGAVLGEQRKSTPDPNALVENFLQHYDVAVSVNRNVAMAVTDEPATGDDQERA